MTNFTCFTWFKVKHFTPHLNYYLIGVTFNILGIIFKIVSNLPGVINDNRQRIKKQSTIERIILQLQLSFCYFMSQTKIFVTSLFFV